MTTLQVFQIVLIMFLVGVLCYIFYRLGHYDGWLAGRIEQAEADHKRATRLRKTFWVGL